jgi:hypothetical protein
MNLRELRQQKKVRRKRNDKVERRPSQLFYSLWIDEYFDLLRTSFVACEPWTWCGNGRPGFQCSRTGLDFRKQSRCFRLCWSHAMSEWHLALEKSKCSVSDRPSASRCVYPRTKNESVSLFHKSWSLFDRIRFCLHRTSYLKMEKI